MSASKEVPDSQPKLKKRKRRRASHPLLVATVASAATLNHLAAERIWRSGPTTLTTLPYDGPKTNVAGIVFPGLGSFGGEMMAKQLATALPSQPWAFFTYDNKRGIKIEALAEQLRQYQQEQGFEYLDLYGHSIGQPTGIEAGRIAGIPFRIVLGHSGPFHVRDGPGGWLAEHVMDKIPYDFGLAGKLAVTLTANTLREGLGQTRRNLSNAISETFKGGSTTLLRSQIKAFRKIDFRNWRRYRDIIVPKFTKAGYARSEKDTTVNVRRSYQKWKDDFFDPLEVPLDLIQTTGVEHANILDAIPYIRQWLQNGDQGVVFSRATT